MTIITPPTPICPPPEPAMATETMLEVLLALTSTPPAPAVSVLEVTLAETTFRMLLVPSVAPPELPVEKAIPPAPTSISLSSNARTATEPNPLTVEELMLAWIVFNTRLTTTDPPKAKPPV